MSNGYEMVNNPYDPGSYNPGGYPTGAPTNAAPAPVSAPPGWAQAPDGSWYQVPATTAAPPSPAANTGGGYPAGVPASPPATAAPSAPPPVPPSSPSSNGGHERRQLIELRTQNGQPLEQLNYVMMTGYFHHMRDQQGNVKYTETANSIRLGFSLAEKQSWTDAQGQTQVRVVWHRCQAWNDFARVLVQVQDGTPIKIGGNLTKYYIRDDQGNITGELVDIKITKYEFP